MPGGAIACTQALPSNILNMFKAKSPIEHREPIEKRKMPPLSGCAAFVSYFTPTDQDDYKPVVHESPLERRTRIGKIKKAKHEAESTAAIEAYDPQATTSESTEDAFKTLFVARLAYDVDERKLEREFGAYGKIKKLRIVADVNDGKPKGYAFVEFEDERDMKAAYKQADGQKINGRRVVVDVERGRTVKNWKPRRIGGGLGGTRIGKPSQNQRYSGREPYGTGAGGGSGGGGDRDRDRNRDRGSDRRDRDRGSDRRDRDRGSDRRDRDRDRDRGSDRNRDRDRDRKSDRRDSDRHRR